MKIHFTGRAIEVTEALKNYTTEKFQRLERRNNNITNIHVIFSVEHTNHIAEATLHTNGADLHAKVQKDDMYAAIDELTDRLSTQLIKHKEKHSEH